jgi:hypothetical protein
MVVRPYFPSKPCKLDYIYFHIGRVSVLWADAESSLDRILEIFALANPNPLYVVPTGTKRRISTFRSQIKKVRLTDDVRAKGLALIDRFSFLAWHRHWTTHGTSDTRSILGATWRANKGYVALSRQHISTREWEDFDIHLCDIEEMGDEALALFSALVEWKAFDLGCSTPKRTEKFCREGGMRLGRVLPLGKASDDAG